MPHSNTKGFILPLMLILLLVSSLLLLTLYEAESAHLSLFNIVNLDQQSKQALPQLEIQMMANVSAANSNAHQMAPNPSNNPANNTPYLRSIDPQNGNRIWQERSGSWLFLLSCSPDNSCGIMRLHRLV